MKFLIYILTMFIFLSANASQNNSKMQKKETVIIFHDDEVPTHQVKVINKKPIIEIKKPKINSQSKVDSVEPLR